MPISARRLLPLFVVLGCGGARDEGRGQRSDGESAVLVEPAEPAEDAPPPSGTLVAARPLNDATLSLVRDASGLGTLWLQSHGSSAQRVPCDRLVGAWGLWVDDVERDGHPEAIVALRKPARFDPRVDNRLHVYGIEDGRCVPAWRGTRLAGRFDALRTDPETPGSLVVSERLGADRRRVARYRWTGFGYAVDSVIWEGTGAPPLDLVAGLVVAPDFSKPTVPSPPS